MMRTANDKTRKKATRFKKTALTVFLAALMLPAVPVYAGTSSDKLDQVLDILSTKHVSGTGSDVLSEAAIRGMVASLKDPYTQYMSKEDWARFKNQLERHYVGIGIVLGKDDKGLYIGDIYPGSPAEEAGLQTGDYILEADGKSLAGISTSEAAALLQGKENTELLLTLMGKDGQTRVVKAVRRQIQLPVLESKLLDGGVGYIRLYSFAENADQLFADALSKLKADPSFRTLVLDLRDNPGGLLNSAVGIASHFISNGTLIHTRDRDGNDTPVVIQSGEEQHEPVYVMVNENSASCSEVLAGALQDYHAAVIAGTRSFGKGSVQQVYTFSDGSSLKVTVEEYLTPEGHKVNGVGIHPDLELDGDMNQLLMVLRNSGLKTFTVEKNRMSVTVNGMKVQDELPVFEADGKLWVHSRVLADLAGAETVWHSENSSVEIKPEGAGTGTVFSETLGNARYDGGLMYLDANAFVQTFPDVSIQGDAEQLKMSSGQGGH